MKKHAQSRWLWQCPSEIYELLAVMTSGDDAILIIANFFNTLRYDLRCPSELPLRLIIEL